MKHEELQKLTNLLVKFPDIAFQPDATWEGAEKRFAEIELEFQNYLKKDKENPLEEEQRKILRDLCNRVGRYFTRIQYQADKGIVFYKHAVEIDKALREPNRKIAKSLCGLGNAYVDNGQNEHSIEYYQQACELLENEQKTATELNHLEESQLIATELGTAYHHLGSAYYGMGLEDALVCYEKERVLLASLYKENDYKNYMRVVGLNINIGNVERDIKNNPKLAFELFSSVIDWIEEHKPRDAQPPAFLFTAYRARGKAQTLMGKIEPAIEDFKKAEKIYLSLNSNTTHPHMFAILDGKADALFAAGKIEEATEAYQEALKINEHLHKNKATGHPDLATSFRKMGKLAIQHGEYSEAEEWLSKALEMYTKTLYPEHFDIKATKAEILELETLRNTRKNFKI